MKNQGELGDDDDAKGKHRSLLLGVLTERDEQAPNAMEGEGFSSLSTVQEVALSDDLCAIKDFGVT